MTKKCEFCGGFPTDNGCTEFEWFSPDVHPPEGAVVLAEYHPFNKEANKLKTHAVWFYKGSWRPAWHTGDSHAWVKRWCYVGTPASTALVDAAENLVIGIGMGWDLEGLVDAVIKALPAGSPLRGQG